MALTENHIRCAHCDKDLISYTGKSETLMCHHCGQSLIVSMGQSFASGKPIKLDKESELQIPLGTELNIRKVTYRVVGFARLKETDKPYYWDEYTLYNESEGFVTLSAFDNTFNLVRPFQPTEGDFVESRGGITATYKDADYRLYNKYGIHPKYAQGEFAYNLAYVFSEETVAREFLNPPDLIIIHEKVDHQEFFRAQYVNPKDIEKSIGYLPKSDSINPTKTLLGGVKGFHPVALLMLFLLLLTFLAFVQNTVAPETLVFKQGYQFTAGDTTQKNLISPSFELSGWGSSLSVDLIANVSNSWFAMGFELVNETDNSSISFENGVEYYSGYTDGESWSEGSTTNDVNITAIKPGRYHLVMQPVFDGKAPVNVTVQAYKDRMFFSNYLVIFILAAIFPAIFYYLDYSLDRKRWYSSNYSPYTYYDDE